VFRPKIERDPEVSNLVSSVNQQLQNILKSVEPEPITHNTSVKFVSFEEALRELVDLKNKKS